MRNKTDLRLVVGSTVLLFIVLGAVLAPFGSIYLPGSMDITQRLLPPSHEHWLGTDLKGIDIWTSLLYGARTSLTISFSTVLVSTVFGSWLGLTAGYYGGWFEQLVMRIIDILMAFPGMILPLTLATLLVPTYFNLVLAISLTGWIASARLVRAEMLSLKERDYVIAAQALGAPPASLLLRHLLPALFPVIFTHMTTSIAGVILIESGLSFLGLGPRGKVPTWGQLLSQGRSVMVESPLLAIAPGLAIFVVILAVNLIGDSLRDRFEQRV